jgi:ATP-dependent DNA ligase
MVRVPPAPFPRRIVSMQPELASEPFHREGWVYEEKYDGGRNIAHKDGPRVRPVCARASDPASSCERVAP